MKKLYPGMPFSPPATTSENIGAADTIIKVSDVSLFPDAPNYATLGTDEDGETILYTAKTSEALSGCRRGVEGTAKAWPANSPIARNFTAADHEDLIEAIGEINDARGEPSGIATLDGEGLIPESQRAVADDNDSTTKFVLGFEDGELYIKEV